MSLPYPLRTPTAAAGGRRLTLQESRERKSDSEVALELMRVVLEQAGGRRLSPTRTLSLYHLCREAVAYSPEGAVSSEYLEDGLKKLLQ